MKKFLAAAFAPACFKSELIIPGFTNPFYPAFGYTGSRLLETNHESNAYSDVTWTQTASIDPNGGIFIADTRRHAIIFVNSTQSYRDFPSEGVIFAGQSNAQGYRDGTLLTSLLNGPKGVANFESPTNKYLYISDTSNHCIRRIDIGAGSIETIAGIPGQSGFRDGDGRKALFNDPTSIGVDPTTGLVFVLDNRAAIRMLNITDSGVFVDTLVGGACRALSTDTVYETIVVRTVRCQTGWTVSSPGSSDIVNRWEWPETCLGNSVTCSTRYDEL